MTLTELISTYKGEITFTVNAIVDGESKIIARIDSDEGTEAIKDNILNSEVLNYTVEVTNKVPATASIEVMLKEIAAETTEEGSTANSDGGTDTGGETT